jgi:hypothetical protein
MPSFLVTRKMSPELAARVQASVEGRRAAPGARLAPRAISLFRFALVATIVTAVVWFALSRHRARQHLESERAALLDRVRRQSASLSDAEKAITTRVLTWLTRSAGRYEGDLVVEELRSKDALAAVLARPAIYVRGTLSSFANGAAGLKESASNSRTDAFVLCLISPPTARTEKLLRGKARAAYGGVDREQAAGHIERLDDALEGLPFLAPEWQTNITDAKDKRALDKLRRQFERAPIEGAKRVAKAGILLFAIDEPGDSRGPTELDGERPHEVRVGLVDLAAPRVLLRLRKRVDPGWISPAVRAEYASGIDSCALALDVRTAVDEARAVSAVR